MEPLSLFTPGKIGNLLLRNRSIRSAAFEGMSPGHLVSDDLINYHRSVAAGGIGMTTVAYASVSQSGLSFEHQLWLRKDAVPGLRDLTDAVHAEGAAVSVQIGHCGLMGKYSLAGGRPIAPTGKFNLYGPTFPRKMNKNDINTVITDFGNAVDLARESGFDAVEVHAGHGYLISQFLSLYTNKRKDDFGGSFENRTRFMTEVMREVRKRAGNDLAVLVKMNLRDGFKGGMELDEAVRVAGILEQEGADAIIPSGGFTSRAPMYVMRGRMPVEIMGHGVKNPVTRFLILRFGDILVKAEPYSEDYFLEDALQVRKAVNIPVVYVGGADSRESIDKILSNGFEFVSFARALVHDPAYMNKLKNGEAERSGCLHSNYCIAVMYTGKMRCFQDEKDIPEKWDKMLRERKNHDR
jgi:2,4-dienoyl-CoA reductase-like NADH-dependent reductase (Old Yellow Enzyme family)